MLGDIRRHTHRALRGMRGEAREDAFAEVVASCYVAFDRLCKLDKQDLAYPSVLVRYAVAQYFAGRRVGNRFRKRDVFSPANKRPVLHIGQRSGWHELLIDDHSTPVSDQAAFRIDFPAWLESLSGKKRRVAEALAEEQLDVWLRDFAWDAPEILGADVVKKDDPAESDEFVDRLAEFLWNHRHELSNIENK